MKLRPADFKSTRREVARIAATLRGLLLLGLSAAPPLRAAGAAELRQPYVVVQPVRVGRSGSNFRNPAIAISPRPSVTVVVESGAIGSRRLVRTDATRGWLTPVPIEISGPGDCRNPCLAYDSSGTLHLLWSEKVDETYAVRYATCSLDGEWKDEGLLSQSPELDCDRPQLALDDQGRFWAAWQAGLAVGYGIYLCRWEPGQSPPSPTALTGENADHHNLSPQLFPDSPYPIVWYEEDGTRLRLRAAVEDEEAGGFQIIPPLDFDRLDSNLQPRLFRAPGGMLGGVWTDSIGGRGRVLVGLQNGSTQGEGFLADMTDSGDALYPSALGLEEGAIALAWVSRVPTGSRVMVARVQDDSRVGPSRMLAEMSDGTLTQPHLVSDGLFVHCVWISDAARGGSGDLYYSALVY